jgi:hypothetical protein
MNGGQLKNQLLLAKLISFLGYLLPTYAAYHWYPRYMSDIDNPSTRFIAVLVLSVIFVLGGQVYESFLFEKRIAAIESASVIPTEALC